VCVCAGLRVYDANLYKHVCMRMQICFCMLRFVCVCVFVLGICNLSTRTSCVIRSSISIGYKNMCSLAISYALLTSTLLCIGMSLYGLRTSFLSYSTCFMLRACVGERHVRYMVC
jgi:hypothetical protein